MEMETGYKIKHIFNYMLKGSNPHKGKFNLARLAIMEDIDQKMHVVLLYPKNTLEKVMDPTTYLNANLPGMASSG